MKWWLGLSLLCTVGCGDPLVGESFLGTPMFSVNGSIQQTQAGGRMHDPANIRLSLFWIGFDSRTEARDPVEQEATVDNQFAGFEMTVFDPPVPEALRFDDLLLEPESGLGLALIVLYVDNNENGILNSYGPSDAGPDIVLGASPNHLIAYTTDTLPATSSAAAILGEIEPGYHLYEYAGAGECAFVEAEHCTGDGTLKRVAFGDVNIVLALEPTAAEVRVPSPALPRAGSDTQPNRTLYGGR